MLVDLTVQVRVPDEALAMISETMGDERPVRVWFKPYVSVQGRIKGAVPVERDDHKAAPYA